MVAVPGSIPDYLSGAGYSSQQVTLDSGTNPLLNGQLVSNSEAPQNVISENAPIKQIGQSDSKTITQEFFDLGNHNYLTTGFQASQLGVNPADFSQYQLAVAGVSTAPGWINGQFNPAGWSLRSNKTSIWDTLTPLLSFVGSFAGVLAGATSLAAEAGSAAAPAVEVSSNVSESTLAAFGPSAPAPSILSGSTVDSIARSVALGTDSLSNVTGISGVAQIGGYNPFYAFDAPIASPGFFDGFKVTPKDALSAAKTVAGIAAKSASVSATKPATQQNPLNLFMVNQKDNAMDTPQTAAPATVPASGFNGNMLLMILIAGGIIYYLSKDAK